MAQRTHGVTVTHVSLSTSYGRHDGGILFVGGTLRCNSVAL